VGTPHVPLTLGAPLYQDEDGSSRNIATTQDVNVGISHFLRESPTTLAIHSLDDRDDLLLSAYGRIQEARLNAEVGHAPIGSGHGRRLSLFEQLFEHLYRSTYPQHRLPKPHLLKVQVAETPLAYFPIVSKLVKPRHHH